MSKKIRTIRFRLGIWLAKPVIEQELWKSRDYHAGLPGGSGGSPQERYWMGRCTALRNILDQGRGGRA